MPLSLRGFAKPSIDSEFKKNIFLSIARLFDYRLQVNTRCPIAYILHASKAAGFSCGRTDGRRGTESGFKSFSEIVNVFGPLPPKSAAWHEKSSFTAAELEF